MASIRLEPLAEAHLPDVLRIERACQTAPWSEASFRNEIGHPHGVFLVALAGREVVGFGGCWILVDEAHITTLAVDPLHRRQGVGRFLMDALLRRAATAGAICSTLEVRSSNEAAIKLYEEMGYVATTRRKGYYPDNREDALVMWLHDLSKWSNGD
ncbi:MAG: ribosomal protein S18-alanine N-acetyltransferase [Fimbriimonadaceae bacterium]